MKNRICQLFEIEKPIVQGGMVWCSGWELASAVSNAGALGVIGAGSMYPEILREQIIKCKKATVKPFAVNFPLLYPQIEEHIQTVIDLKVPIVFTSAGNPNSWTKLLQENGIRVVHVVSSLKFAMKAQEAGVDAIVAEGFEAGGHNGRDETTTMVLISEVTKVVDIPVLAAGGIGSGDQMLAAFALGAEGVQMGSKFVATKESSAHNAFKNAVIEAKEGDTQLTLKQVVPVRLIKNKFFETVQGAQLAGATKEELKALLGHGRAKLGMFQGDLEEGELEIGQISLSINQLQSASEVVDDVWCEFRNTQERISKLSF